MHSTPQLDGRDFHRVLRQLPCTLGKPNDLLQQGNVLLRNFHKLGVAAFLIQRPETGETEIALTLLRCMGMLSRDDMPVRQGHTGPGMATPGAQMPGKWRFEYAILPHQGGWEDACQKAYAYETGLRAVSADLHTGELENIGSFIAHTPAEFMISAVKESEDENGWVVRGFNRSSESIELTLKPLRPFSGAMLVNLAEDRIADLTPTADGSIRLPVRGHQIVSILFKD